MNSDGQLMAMDDCRTCRTRITSHYDDWIHLVDGNDNHTPLPRAGQKTRQSPPEKDGLQSLDTDQQFGYPPAGS